MQRSHIIVAALLLAGLLAGCREEEQGRHYVLDKGNYTGKADIQLTPAQVTELNSRATLQATANVTGGAARRPAEERPAPPQSEALGKRLEEQSGK